MELYEKIYVKAAFLATDHGQIPCVQCHGGNPQDNDWQTAHEGVIKDPTYPDAQTACGECHGDISSSAKHSLHYTLAPFDGVVRQRSTKLDPATQRAVLMGQARHCRQCHASCGQCHVSRPNYAAGGFLDHHLFQKTPPMEVTCASCHGGRLFAEYTGLKKPLKPDIHYERGEMQCLDCHSGKELHAAAEGIRTRFELPQRPACLTCHPEAKAADSANSNHRIHQGKLACQVCHAQAAKNCFGCHVGTDRHGLPYFKCEHTVMLFKIGLNPQTSIERPHLFVALRHPPADPGLFDAYVKGGLGDFDRLPTWKVATPHNIRRRTPQNRTCNSCHGRAVLFLRQGDVAQQEMTANAAVIVPPDRVPAAIEPSSMQGQQPQTHQTHQPKTN